MPDSGRSARMKSKFLHTFLALALVVIVLLCPTLIERHRFYQFDQLVWRASPPKDRYYMAHFLMDKDMLKGLSKPDVIRMLGEPYQDRGYIIAYNLGPERGFISVDGVVMDIYFDASGVLTEMKIRTT